MSARRVRDAASDLSRPRELAWGAVGAGLGLGLLLAFGRVDAHASPGPLALPHTQAGVTCKSCHENSGGVVAACAGCHEPSKHVSARAGHRTMTQKGEMSCVTCHSAHGETQGVTLAENGDFVRFGHGQTFSGSLGHVAPKSAVPLVPAGVCVRCHDLGNVADPAARCVSNRLDPSKQADLCMDEHPLNAIKYRPASWDCAREVAAKTSWLDAESSRSTWAWALLPLVSAGALAGASRKLRSKKLPPAPLPQPSVSKRRLPQINTATCLGCYACVDACPFDVIEVQKFVAVVTRPGDCCGVIACREVCPNGSLTIAEEGVQRGVPRVDEHLESIDNQGIFIAGDLTGVPLIRNAIEQGARVAKEIAKKAKNKHDSSVLDLVIVGAGPAGLAAALSAKEHELSFVVIEQSTVAASVQSFPRNKLVLDRAIGVPLEGALWMKETTKEELLLEWSRILRKHKISVRERERVVGVTRVSQEGTAADIFEITTSAGSLRARHVLLATGRRGTPQTVSLEIAAGAEGKVSHSLADARSFAGQRVLVVGLGDSAMETALALSNQPGTRVTVCHRGADFKRGKARNVDAMKLALARETIEIIFESQLTHVGRESVTLRGKDAESTFAIDAVFLMIGGTPATELLRAAGVRFEGDE